MSAAEHTPKTIAAAALVVAGLGVALIGCDQGASSVDCSRICDKYQACLNPDYDISACDSRCQESGDSPASTDGFDACESCIDDETCGGPANACDDECAGIVP